MASPQRPTEPGAADGAERPTRPEPERLPLADASTAPTAAAPIPADTLPAYAVSPRIVEIQQRTARMQNPLEASEGASTRPDRPPVDVARPTDPVAGSVPAAEGEATQRRLRPAGVRRAPRLLAATSVGGLAALAALTLFGAGDGPPLATVILSSEPAGATIVLDGSRLPFRTPATIQGVRAGVPLALAFEHLGEERWRQSVTFPPGQTSRVHALLGKAPASDDPGNEEQGEPEQAPAGRLEDRGTPKQPSERGAPEEAAPGGAVAWAGDTLMLRARTHAVRIPGATGLPSLDLDPRKTWTVSAEGAASISRGGRSTSLVYFAEGATPRYPSWGLLDASGRAFTGVRRLTFFALDDTPAGNDGSIRVRAWTPSRPDALVATWPAARGVLTPANAPLARLAGLRPNSHYRVAVRASGIRTLGVTQGESALVLCALVSGEGALPVQVGHWLVETGQRRELTGVSELLCAFPDDDPRDNEGVVEIDVVELAGTPRHARP